MGNAYMETASAGVKGRCYRYMYASEEEGFEGSVECEGEE